MEDGLIRSIFLMILLGITDIKKRQSHDMKIPTFLYRHFTLIGESALKEEDQGKKEPLLRKAIGITDLLLEYGETLPLHDLRRRLCHALEHLDPSYPLPDDTSLI